jgi:hypothetical protein
MPPGSAASVLSASRLPRQSRSLPLRGSPPLGQVPNKGGVGRADAREARCTTRAASAAFLLPPGIASHRLSPALILPSPLPIETNRSQAASAASIGLRPPLRLVALAGRSVRFLGHSCQYLPVDDVPLTPDGRTSAPIWDSLPRARTDGSGLVDTGIANRRRITFPPVHSRHSSAARPAGRDRPESALATRRREFRD